MSWRPAFFNLYIKSNMMFILPNTFIYMQVLSQLPSLHQLNLRGCPIADKPDYQAQLLQQLPMLDVLDSRKVSKTGMPRTAKPAVANAQSKIDPTAKATHEPGAVTNSLPGSNQVKSKKRQPQVCLEEPNDPTPKPKKAKRDKSAVASDTVTVDSEQMPSAPAARAEDAKGHDVQKSDAKRKCKADKQSRKQATADDSGRSFLADVLNPTEAEFATAPEANGQQQSKPEASSAKAASSGLVKVVDAKTKGKKAKKVKQKGGEIGREAKDGVSGSRAAQLLQSSLGLDVLQVGLGGNAAWE